MRNLGVGPVTWWSRTPGGGVGRVRHRAARGRRGDRRGRRTRCSCTARSTSGRGYRFGQPHARPMGPAAARLVLHLRHRHAGEDVRALVPPVHARVTARPTRTSVATRSSARRYAATNPKAWFHDRPITLEDHQASRWIVEPVLRLYDCCQESDGGVALVVTRAERAGDVDAAGRDRGGRRRPSRRRQHHRQLLPRRPGDVSRGGGSARGSCSPAPGSRPADIDVAEIYENFSPLVFLVLEAYGFCGPGEAVAFIADGNLDLDGALPTNTHGGLLGEAYIHGINSIQEGVRQVRGTAVNQVPTVDHVSGELVEQRPGARTCLIARRTGGSAMAEIAPVKVGVLVDYVEGSEHVDPVVDRVFRLTFDEYLASGVLERPIELVLRAAQGLPNGSFRGVRDAFHELVAEDCVAIFGPYVSENGEPLRRYVEELAEVPILTMAGTESMLGEWVFALNNGSMEEEPIIMAAVCRHDGRQSVGIAYEQSLIGQEYLATCRRACVEAGLRITGEVAIPQVATEKRVAMEQLRGGNTRRHRPRRLRAGSARDERRARSDRLDAAAVHDDRVRVRARQ